MWLSVYKLNCERNPPRASRAATGTLIILRGSRLRFWPATASFVGLAEWCLAAFRIQRGRDARPMNLEWLRGAAMHRTRQSRLAFPI